MNKHTCATCEGPCQRCLDFDREQVGRSLSSTEGTSMSGDYQSALDRLLTIVDRLLDPDVVSPYISAWEFDHTVDADRLPRGPR